MNDVDKYFENGFKRYVILLWDSRHTLIVTALIVAILSALYAFTIAPKRFMSKSTFFVTQSSGSGASNLLGQYSRFLNVSGGKNLTVEVFYVLKSNRIKDDTKFHFVSRLITNPDSKSELERLNKLFDKADILVSKNFDDIFELNVLHQIPEVAHLIATIYLEQLNNLNKELGLSGKKDLVTVIDAPQLPETPYEPRKPLIIAVSTVFAVILRLFFIIFRVEYKRFKQFINKAD